MQRALVLIAVAALALTAVAAVRDSAVSIKLPGDAEQFGPGAGQGLALANCTICHAADYVYTQPPLTRDQWRAEVVKMKNAFGAPISDDVIDPLVAYLVTQNGKP